MRSVLALAVWILVPAPAAAVPSTPEVAWQARCVGRIEQALDAARKLDPSFSASRIKAPYEWNHSGKYQESAPGVELRLQRSDQPTVEAPFTVAVHLEMTGHESSVPEAWTNYWGKALDPARRFFWAREHQELVDLATPGDTALWRYQYSRRQGNILASIGAEYQLVSPALLRRLVQLFEPAADDCLQWGKELPKVLSPHPMTDWPVSPPEPQRTSAPRPEPPFQTQIFGADAVQLKLIDPADKSVWSCIAPGGAAKACGAARGWLSASELHLLNPYKLRVDSGKTTTVRKFFADGSEQRFVATIVGSKRPVISIARVLRSSADVTLEQAWRPAAENTPEYQLTNRSPRTIYGTSTFGNFFGDIERWNGDRWEAVPKLSCGTVSPAGPLGPGESQRVDLGCVIARSALTPGRYRFWLTYAHLSLLIDALPELREEFEVDAEFTIAPQP